MTQRSKTRQRGRAGVTASRVHVHVVYKDVFHELHVVVVVVNFTSILSSVLDVVVHMALVDVLVVGTIFVAIFVVREIYSLHPPSVTVNFVSCYRISL